MGAFCVSALVERNPAILGKNKNPPMRITKIMNSENKKQNGPFGTFHKSKVSLANILWLCK